MTPSPNVNNTLQKKAKTVGRNTNTEIAPVGTENSSQNLNLVLSAEPQNHVQANPEGSEPTGFEGGRNNLTDISYSQAIQERSSQNLSLQILPTQDDAGNEEVVSDGITQSPNNSEIENTSTNEGTEYNSLTQSIEENGEQKNDRAE